MHTLVEIFSDKPIENVVSCLAMKPKKVIYIGFDMPMHQRNDIERFFKAHNLHPVVEYVTVNGADLENVICSINKIIDTNKDCAIELGGGNELISAAVGAVSVSKNVPVFRYNIADNSVIDIYRFNTDTAVHDTDMNIDEFIQLYGGAVNDSKAFRQWNMDSEFEKDIMGLWRIYAKNCTLWNRQMTIIALLDELDSDSRPDWVYVEQSRLKAHNRKAELDRRIMSQLCDSGYISGFIADKNKIMYRYKNPQIRAVLTKTGNLLELYTYIAVRNLEISGKKFFNDAEIGLCLDWDGIIHYGAESVMDTVNEVDVVAMHANVPVFISCKSGEVKKEALYELHTIADKFGGSHARKILVTTDSRSSETKLYLKQRAADMGITIIENIHNKSPERFSKELIFATTVK